MKFFKKESVKLKFYQFFKLNGSCVTRTISTS